ncbi:MAG TPA: MarR family transcriptional regulator [Pseudolysinimonas sp.]|nr:MarR family transcriptional regulator [Pseudolysinimonas sp.]
MDEPRFSPTIALVTLARAAEVEVARILEPSGLSVRKLAILHRLSAVPGATPADLGRTLGVTAEDVRPLLRAMTTAGLIRSGRDGALSVTEAGAAAIRGVDAALAELDGRLFAGREALSAALADDL